MKKMMIQSEDFELLTEELDIANHLGPDDDDEGNDLVFDDDEDFDLDDVDDFDDFDDDDF